LDAETRYSFIEKFCFSLYKLVLNFEASPNVIKIFGLIVSAKVIQSARSFKIITIRRNNNISSPNSKAFGDSLLVVQQILGECQFLEGSSNTYLDKCLDVIKFNFDEFCIHHIPRHENCRANNLAQGASG
jgi:hypothetical protein